MTAVETTEAVRTAARLLPSMGATGVFVFGSLVRGELRPDSDMDMDMAVSGLPARLFSRRSGVHGSP